MRQYVERQVGFGDEFWKPLTDHLGYSGLVKRLQTLGRDASLARYYLTRALLLDVIHAAGAVEYTAAKIESLLDEAQTWVDENRSLLPSPAQWSADGPGVTHAALDATGYEFGNLVGWIRAVGDRIKRAARGSQANLGLLPSMNRAHPATSRVHNLFISVLSDPGILKDVAELAAFSLHSSAIPTSGHKPRITTAGKILIPIPDKLKQKVWTSEEFTYNQGRDLRTFSEDHLRLTARFVDGLLRIFEDYSGSNRWVPR